MSEHQNPQLRSWSDAPLSAYAAPEPTAFVDGPFGSDLKVSDYAESGCESFTSEVVTVASSMTT
jgi:hypothetical protein